MNDGVQRCWARKPLDLIYHDNEWGVPHHDDRELFELLILEGAQAGLSWSTILAKRENYRRAFDNFDATKIARYRADKIAALLGDPGIVRNRLKIAATIANARAFLATQREFGSFDRYLWSFVDHQPIVNRRRWLADIPARTAESDVMSKDLLKRGFKFVGSTICYAFMQASGMVNDHLVTCPRHAACAKLKQFRCGPRKPYGLPLPGTATFPTRSTSSESRTNQLRTQNAERRTPGAVRTGVPRSR